MSKTTEASIQATLKQALETCGYTVLEIAKGRSSKAAGLWTGTTPGAPDMLVSHPDWPTAEWLGLELKTPTGKVRPEQQKLADLGRVVIVRSVADGLREVGCKESDMKLAKRIGDEAYGRHSKLISLMGQFREANP